MKRPVIGIVSTIGPDPTADEREIYYVGTPYVDRIVEAGGFPVMFAPGSDVREANVMIDGWLIIGGRDIPPSRYGQEPHPTLEPERESRFKFESDLYEIADPSMPVLGICYGCQFLNVVRGGDLIQNVPDRVGNTSHSGGTFQFYRIQEGSKASMALGATTAEGRSYHHQAVDRLGRDLAAVAYAEDGTIEAIEDTGGRWVVGIQWHPERTPELDVSQRLFREFVLKAASYRQEREQCGTW